MAPLSDEEERKAQRIFCSHMVRACATATTELQWTISEAERKEPTMKRAQEILAGELSSWRETLSGLRILDKRSGI